jgi:hypothetical protein
LKPPNQPRHLRLVKTEEVLEEPKLTPVDRFQRIKESIKRLDTLMERLKNYRREDDKDLPSSDRSRDVQ